MEKDPDLIAPCGMNCAVCGAYLSRAHDIRSRGIRQPYCTGCRPRDKQCALLKKRCPQIGEGTIRFCSACPDYPCRRLEGLDRRYRERYHMSMIANLETIREIGVDAFLDREAEKWRCPSCGGTICCHNGICYDCGIDDLLNRKQRMRWTD